MDNLTTAIEEPTQDLFTEEELYSYQYASTGQRFLNFIIDAILIQYGLAFLSGIILGLVLLNLFPDTAESFYLRDNQFVFWGISYLLGAINYLIYYTICEKVFKGRTLGKLISGTRAINEDGTELSVKQAFLRSLCRIVPFEVFSGFGGHPWHDNWTDTVVIKTR